MDSLTTDPVAAVLKRLFQEAEIADRPLMERYRNREVAQDELIKLLEAEAKDYKALYRTYADNFLNVSAEFGGFLYMCAVVVGNVTGPAAALSGSHAEIVTSQRRVVPMSEESVAITVARRSCNPRGVPLPIRWRMTSPRLKPP